jgi:YD repeat-containing protein
MTTEYSPEGKLLATRTTNSDGSEWVTTWIYDADGRLTKNVSGQLGEAATELLYVYDEAGRLLAIKNNANSGDQTEFHYDAQGRKTTIQRFDPKTLQRRQHSAFGGSPWDAARSGFGVPSGGHVTTIYDENDLPTEAQVRDAEGRLLGRVVRTYDADGRISEERPIPENPALMFFDRLPAEATAGRSPEQMEGLQKGLAGFLGGRTPAGTSYTYDVQGRITKMCDRNFAFERTVTTVYNEQGDKAEEITTVTENSAFPIGVPYSVDENGVLTPSKPADETSPVPDLQSHSEIHYAYQYDSYGNWTEQTASELSNRGAPCNVRHRKFTYY